MIWLIALFSISSYFVAIRSILAGEYKPSIYSRVVWFGITLNNLASIYALDNALGIKVMTIIGTIGSGLILFLSLKRSRRIFGRTELISTVLLVLSLLVWVVTQAPFLNLTIGIIAHFIGAIPTIKKAWVDPRDEHIFFWFWFFLAGLVAIVEANSSELSGYLLPAYVIFINGLMALLCLRRFLSKHAPQPH